jgi:phytol kinase
MSSAVLGLLISYLYAGGLLVIGELLHRQLHIPNDITRKVVHVGAGMWIFGVLALFDTWQIGVIPFASFIVLNYVFLRIKLFRGIDSDNASPGTVYFAISITLLSIVLWRPEGPVDQVPAVVAGVMAMTWGDALAALIGKHYGTRTYTIGGSTRTYEGSAVMLVVSFVVIYLALTMLPGSSLTPYADIPSATSVIIASLLGAVVATVVEAFSPHGTDNLTVPICVTLVALIAR